MRETRTTGRIGVRWPFTVLALLATPAGGVTMTPVSQDRSVHATARCDYDQYSDSEHASAADYSPFAATVTTPNCQAASAEQVSELSSLSIEGTGMATEAYSLVDDFSGRYGDASSILSFTFDLDVSAAYALTATLTRSGGGVSFVRLTPQVGSPVFELFCGAPFPVPSRCGSSSLTGLVAPGRYTFGARATGQAQNSGSARSGFEVLFTVPEPASALLLLSGLSVLVVWRRGVRQLPSPIR